MSLHLCLSFLQIMNNKQKAGNVSKVIVMDLYVDFISPGVCFIKSEVSFISRGVHFISLGVCFISP